MRKSAAVMVVPVFAHSMPPRMRSVPAAIPVPMPPTLLIHLPTPRPTTFRTTSTVSRTTEVANAKVLLSASPWWLGPRTNTETPTK